MTCHMTSYSHPALKRNTKRGNFCNGAEAQGPTQTFMGSGQQIGTKVDQNDEPESVNYLQKYQKIKRR